MKGNQKGVIVDVLIIDDDDVDQMLARRKLSTKYRIVEAGDGEEALAILRGKHESKSLNRPYIVLLDINMPNMDGLEFLDELRDDPNLSKTVVFVLTSSEDPYEIEGAYSRHISGYLSKSRISSSFEEIIMLLDAVANAVLFP